MKTVAINDPSDGKPARLAYSVREVALMLNVSTKSVRRLADRGLLKPSRALRHLRFTRENIAKCLAEST